MMLKLGKDISAAEHWNSRGTAYAGEVAGPYHLHRLAVARALISPFQSENKIVVDFGCGDGVMIPDFPKAKIVGMDPDGFLLDKARARRPDATLHNGGVDELAKVATGSSDLLISLNVLAYLTDDEDRLFYEHARRILKPGGIMVVTHSNELFDLFTFNIYTMEFCRRNFNADVSNMLTHSDKPKEAVTYNIRENPLSYRYKLAQHGFMEERQSFINFHPQPPLLGKTDDYLDTLSIAPEDQWKLMFQCSTFGSRATRV